MDVFKLKKYALQIEMDATDSERSGHYRLWLKGPRLYIEKLATTFPDLLLRQSLVEPTTGFDYFLDLAINPLIKVEELTICLEVFKRTLLIESDLDNCFALGWHSKPGKPGKPELTTLGQWVHLAKSYSRELESAGSLPAAGLIAEQMVEFVRRHPQYRTCSGIIAILPSNPEKHFDLPLILAELVAEDTNLPYLREALYKARPTAQMKYCFTLEDKWDNISGSIGVKAEWVKGKNLILIDDIFESGVTLGETAKVLHEAGALTIHGLVATKTLKRRFS